MASAGLSAKFSLPASIADIRSEKNQNRIVPKNKSNKSRAYSANPKDVNNQQVKYFKGVAVNTVFRVIFV